MGCSGRTALSTEYVQVTPVSSQALLSASHGHHHKETNTLERLLDKQAVFGNYVSLKCVSDLDYVTHPGPTI